MYFHHMNIDAMKSILLLFFLFISFAFVPADKSSGNEIIGAWEFKSGSEVHTIIFSEKYWALAEYNLQGKLFSRTYGGSWQRKNDSMVFTREFDSEKAGEVGQEITLPFKLTGKDLSITISEKHKNQKFTRVDDGSPGKLAGAWLITGRFEGNSMQKITPGARRTMKILSGTRFQWIAYNTETREFFGTGGGTYTTRDGKYTESIQFFSRDNSRVGKSLEFDFALNEGAWRHTGLSSKGDPIDEVWSKREQIGI